MANSGLITVQPLVAAGAFNWVFLIEILVCGVLALFFLFYFNRLFATLIAYLIRAWTWHQYRAYIDISALQISLLGGRVFFKSIRYHAHNVTVLVYEGHITWRYWLRLVQDAEVYAVENTGQRRRAKSAGSQGEANGAGEKGKTRSRSIGKEENAGGKPKKELPCRISIKVSGVEAFVYNRSPVYDMVVEQTRRAAQSKPPNSGTDGGSFKRQSSSSSDNNNEKKPQFKKTATHDTTGMNSIAQTVSHEAVRTPEIPSFLRMFPIRIECRRAAAAIGNENTTSVIAAKLDKAAGTVDAGQSGPLDLFKLLFNFDLENINVTMKPNRDFKAFQRDAGRRILRERELGTPKSKGRYAKFVSKLKKRFNWLKNLFLSHKSVNGSLRAGSMTSNFDGTEAYREELPGEAQWHGLARYLEEKDLDEHDEWKDVEYAKASTLADIERLNFRFYFDMPGTVSDFVFDDVSSAFAHDMNGSKPPDYGMEFAVHGGTVTYGPWTDRQRLNLQQVFFPAAYVDATPAEPLKAGATRNWSLFNILVIVEKDVTLRIPSRESSKDGKWQGRAAKNKNQDDPDGPNVKGKHKHGRRARQSRRRKGKQSGPGVDARPYAWLDVTVKTDSTVSYEMDMFSRADGYVNNLNCDIKGTEITSSVNHGLLWRTGAVSLTADLSQARTWNSLRKWPFDIKIDDLELFILRDHMFLIIDLVNDWSYGPPPDFFTFVPYIYSLRMLFNNFIIYLNVNDANIVNDPADLEKNDFLTLEGTLDATLDINMDKFRPIRNFIAYDVLATDMRMRMLSPTRSTINTFLKDKLVADLPKLTLSGSYSGHLEERPGITDTLRFDIVGTGLTLKAYGFLVRLLINVKENYFGDYMHFKTLEEFQGADEDLAVANIKTASIPKPKSINELDVMLCIIAEDVTVLVPTNIYSCHEFVRLELPVANLDLRIVSYYLDMGLQLSPVTILSGALTSDDDESQTETASSAQMFCKHVDLDGHRAFGLPPDEPAYVNQWNIDIGAITGEFSSSFLHDLAMAGRAFIFGFQDRENALPLPSPSVFFDATFVQVRTDTVRIWFRVGKDAILLATDPVEVVTNDWAGETFSQRVSVLVPKLTLACIDAKAASRTRARETVGRSGRVVATTTAFFQTGVAINVVERKLDFAEERRKQQAHIRECDLRTHRVDFLQRRGFAGALPALDVVDDCFPAAMPYPPLPPPLEPLGDGNHRPASINSSSSAGSRKRLRTKGSSASLAASLKLSAASVHPRIQTLEQEDTLRTPSSRSMRSSSRASSTDSETQQPTKTKERRKVQPGMRPSTVAFSSPYAAPHFQLDIVDADEANVPNFLRPSGGGDAGSKRSSISEQIDNPEIEGDAAQTSVLITVVPGIRAYFEPRVIATGAKLFRKLLPKHPEEIMDSYQMDVLGAVTSKQDEQHGANTTLEIQISLPAAHLRVANPIPQSSDADHVDVKLTSVEALVRTRSIHHDNGAEQRVAVHATLENIKATVATKSHSIEDVAPVNLEINDLLLYLALGGPLQTVNVSVGESIVAISGQQAAYLTDVVFRILPVLEELKTRIEQPLNISRERLLLLIRTLLENSEDVGDPIFLSRMVYILRAFPEHFRNADSWKILMRLRHVLENLSADVQEKLTAQIKQLSTFVFSEVPVKALDEWASWRNWDVPNIHHTEAFRHVMDEDDMSLPAADRTPLTLAVRSEYLRVAITADNESNELVLQETTAALHQTPPTAPTGLMLLDENTRTRTEFQLHTTSIGLSANWSVFKIVEHILPCVDKLQALAAPIRPPPLPAEQHMEYGLTRHVFHVVISTDSGSIALHSLNLRHLSRANGLKMSVIGTTKAEDPYGPCASALINADAAITELHGPTRQIWSTNLVSPSVYVDHLEPRPGAEVPPSVTVAIGYKLLDLAVVEPVPGLLHIVNSVVVDEVAQVLKLVKNTKPSSSGTSKLATPGDSQRRHSKIHLALLAGDLQMQLSLLQALQYQLRGTAASVRMAPSLTQDRTWAIDFEIGQQMHLFVNSSSSIQHEQNILAVPPINGHVGLSMEDDVTSLSVATTMQQVEIDATAIQGVMGIVNKPEVQKVIGVIKHGIEDIQRHVEDLMPESDAPKTASDDSGQQLAFDVRFGLAGVRIATTTPASRGNSKAEVEFGIGAVHAVASNRGTFAQNRSLMPEVHAQVRDIGARLRTVTNGNRKECGNASFGILVHFKSHIDSTDKLARELKVQSAGLAVNAYPETAFTAVDVINHLQDQLKDLDLSSEMDYLRRLRDSRRNTVIQKISRKGLVGDGGEATFSAADLLSVTTTVELTNIRVAWIVPPTYGGSSSDDVSDIMLGLDRVEFTTRGGREARLAIQDLQVQLVKHGNTLTKRALNSALMPEVSFTVAYWTIGKSRSLAFKAAGKPLEIRLESKFIVPVNAVASSITDAIEQFKLGTATWKSTPTSSGAPRAKIFDTKLLAALLIEADFAGGFVYVQGSGPTDPSLALLAASSQQRGSQHGRYGQFAADGGQMQTTLRAPGIAMKVEYQTQSDGNPSKVNGEIQVEASSNMLLPNVVPLIIEISNGVKEVMQKQNETAPAKQPTTVDAKPGQRFFEDESIVTADPAAIFGKMKVDLGLRVCRQEFALTCQPIAKVDAKAQLDDIYITMNTIDSEDHGRFFAISAAVTKLTAQVKHVYSRDPTFSFDMDAINLSVLNSKHLSGTSGVSAILKINPTRTSINGKQLQDLLLFREIWLPPEIRSSQASSPPPASQPSSGRPEDFFAQKYQSVASAAAFPWNATVSIAELAVDLDLGQSIGKQSFTIVDLWASQAKASNWEQNLCVGMEEMAVTATGRMSGFIRLNKLGVRTSIKWLQDASEHRRTPLIQASAGFQRLRAKAAFDYQAFAFGDIEGFDFLMYNVHQTQGSSRDRLVAVLDCEKAFVFATSTSPAQALGLYQAFDRLIVEKQQAFKQALRDIEKHLRRESTVVPTRFGPRVPDSPVLLRSRTRSSISLHTDVVLTMGTISFGVFPSTFFDSQILKLEANNIQARFAVGLERGRIHSALGMTLGQLQVALASVRRMTAVPRALDVSVDDVVNSAVNAKGGIILRVPKVVAAMQTWQDPDPNNVDYIFKSLFDGKIDVGWNLSRIDFIKNMWVAHSRSLASRLGKALPESAVKITAGPAVTTTADKEDTTASTESIDDKKSQTASAAAQEKITAEVNLPLSRYEYHALEPPVIETPQLRDMGEATPPLEWIGLHRDRLPNVTHQIIIVSLLEVAKEVEEAYEKILGSS